MKNVMIVLIMMLVSMTANGDSIQDVDLQLKNELMPFVFDSNDANTRRSIVRSLNKYLSTVYSDPTLYDVVCTSQNNSTDDQMLGNVRVDVYIFDRSTNTGTMLNYIVNRKGVWTEPQE